MNWASARLTLCKWRAKFGGMDASFMARMKELEADSRRLFKLYVEEKLKEKTSKDSFWPKVSVWPSAALQLLKTANRP